MMKKKKGFLFDWTKYVTKHLVTATVEDTAKQDVVLTFDHLYAIKPFRKAVAGEFTLVGKTVDLLTLDEAAFTVTIHVTVAYAAGAGLNLTFNPTQKGDTVIIAITNNVA